ncbi:hypothetical protein BLA60_32695 [Actinophytocola xinjiangensis]|uniref:PASTA domain-containing protein n=1 Tax=Actinophytocola xinjiangensis TaxID=485602 RepID=A0A7Z0WH22_9PSEU|nr:hypothetical protein [Actinophytocola xinjiangensis]OLF06104.1 hypothetical protein BLA60_32695 [Actinophytocola xinjiangensis]
MSLSVRGFAVAVVTAAAAVLPVLVAAPASATTSDCLEYLEGAGFRPTNPASTPATRQNRGIRISIATY